MSSTQSEASVEDVVTKNHPVEAEWRYVLSLGRER